MRGDVPSKKMFGKSAW